MIPFSDQEKKKAMEWLKKNNPFLDVSAGNPKLTI
jgi:hypothetical protein